MNFHIFCSYGSLYFISQFYHTYASFDIYRLLFAGQYSARQRGLQKKSSNCL